MDTNCATRDGANGNTNRCPSTSHNGDGNEEPKRASGGEKGTMGGMGEDNEDGYRGHHPAGQHGTDDNDVESTTTGTKSGDDGGAKPDATI